MFYPIAISICVIIQIALTITPKIAKQQAITFLFCSANAIHYTITERPQIGVLWLLCIHLIIISAKWKSCSTTSPSLS